MYENENLPMQWFGYSAAGSIAAMDISKRVPWGDRSITEYRESNPIKPNKEYG
jgi:hypothetical protein